MFKKYLKEIEDNWFDFILHLIITICLINFIIDTYYCFPHNRESNNTTIYVEQTNDSVLIK